MVLTLAGAAGLHVARVSLVERALRRFVDLRVSFVGRTLRRFVDLRVSLVDRAPRLVSSAVSATRLWQL